MDVVGGHFSRIEFKTGTALPGSLIAEFSDIARDYVREVHKVGCAQNGPARGPENAGVAISNCQRGTTATAAFAPPPDKTLGESAETSSSATDYGNERNQEAAYPIVGTDVMDLFGSFLPELAELDADFYNNFVGEYQSAF
jgi:hypothetical protein